MIRKNIRFFILISGSAMLIFVLTTLSCKHDPVVQSVCFESQILPIFQSRCAMTGCHDSQTGREGIILTDYNNIMNAGINPGNPLQSKVYRSMNGGEELMPPSGKIDDYSLTLIRSWIETGAENTTNCDLSNVSCDTASVTYSASVQPVFNTNCVGCHNSGSTVNLDGYSALSTYLTTNATKLMDNINYTGAQPMPPSGKMNQCNIRKAILWIQSGYPNN